MENNYHRQHFERDHGADAPEAVNIMSPMTPVTNIESELQKQYQVSHDNTGRTPIPTSDTEKEAVLVGHDSYGMHVVPLEHKADYPETATAVETATVVSPQTPWTPSTEYTKRALSDAGKESLPAGHDEENGGGSKKGDDKKIFGMTRKVFLILVVVLIIVVAAAIGGGVGGAVASSTKSKSEATPTAASSTTSSSTPPPASATSASPSSTSASSTASPTPSISFLNNQTWPRNENWAFQGFSRKNYSGPVTDIMTGDNSKSRAVDLQFDIHSYVWIQNINNCCVNFCANNTKEGYIGYRCQETRQEDSSEAVARVKVWCNDKPSLTLSKSKGCGD